MLPIIVLIGRTNVGKSTLFNKLTKTRNALVADQPKLTRDRQYGYFNIENQKLILIDTAGLDVLSNEIERKARIQTLIAIQESDLILFVVDARDGLMTQEHKIAEKIRKYGKKIILIINKIDGINEISKINDFCCLGFKNSQKISASHNQGIDTLFSKYLIPWINIEFKEKNERKKIEKNINIEKSAIKVAFIGRPNAGKSTLINSLLKEERMITCNIPGTTLDSISTPIEYNDKKYILIDTAGASKNKKTTKNIENLSIIKTLQTIEKTDITLLIIDASTKICHQDLSLADFIINSGKSIVVVINKLDLLNSLEKKNIKDLIKNRLNFLSFSRIHFISALYQKKIFQLFKSINEAYQASNIKINTSVLTKALYIAVKKHQPAIVKGQKIKLKYAHLGSSNPPKIIIHGNRIKYLSESYKRYLINFFYNFLQIKGTPIQVKFKDNRNPYNTKKERKQ